MEKKELAKWRNSNKWMLSSVVKPIKPESLTQEEINILNEIKYLHKELMDNWDDNSIKLGLSPNPYNRIKGWDFYADFGDKAIKKVWDIKLLKTTDIKYWDYNCLAVYRESKLEQLKASNCYGAVVSVYSHSNSHCCTSQVSPEYLKECCIKISKELAFKLHPNLYEYLK